MVNSSEQKQNVGRAIVVLVLGLIVALFLTFNSSEGFNAGVLYSLMGVLTILAYLIWDKF